MFESRVAQVLHQTTNRNMRNSIVPEEVQAAVNEHRFCNAVARNRVGQRQHVGAPR